MLRNSILLSFFAFSAIINCTQQNSSPLNNNLYEYQLQNADDKNISLDTLVNELVDADVILVGEWHAHAGIHLFQARLFSALINQSNSSKLALSMEQFARSKQQIVNDYLEGKIGEHSLIKQANAWSNYKSDYRPLVELAKKHKLDVIAANTTQKIIRCLSKKGIACLDTLNNGERKFVAQKLSVEDLAYKNKFFKSVPHGNEKTKENQYIAQIAWDDTMAESIVNYLNLKPKSRVMHIAGAFHVEEGLGIASRIYSRNPDLNIAIISPTTVANKLKKTTNSYYQLLVNPLPVQWLNEKEMKQAFK